MAKKKVTKEPSKKATVKKEVSIPALLKELAACEDQLEKRKIRAKLRKAGHVGGVSGRGGKATEKTQKAKAKGKGKAKGKKAKKVQVDDDDE